MTQDLMTIREILRRTTPYLESKGCTSPRLDAEVLLADILSVNRLQLYLDIDRPLHDDEIAQYREAVRRRATLEPVAYIVGAREFRSMPFTVTRATLIPRPDTETLVEAALGLIAGCDSPEIVDIGTGSGAVAAAIQPLVRHVVAIDLSDSMLAQGQWLGVSVVKLDIGDSFFADAIFDRVFARMVFHHVVDNLDRAILRCYDILRPGGKIVVAEGVPPVEDPEVVRWFTEMFALKEERRVFVPQDLEHYLRRNGLQNVTCTDHYIEHFSIRNWLENSGLEKDKQEAIMSMHKNASKTVKAAFQMECTADDCFVRSRNVILVGEK